MLCSIFFYVFVLCLSFIFSFILHPSCIIPLLISSFLSLIPLDCFVYSWQKGREYTRENIGLYHHFYMTHVHTLRGSNSTSCIFIGWESYRGDAYTKGEKTFSLFCFGLSYSCALLIACLDDHLLCYMIIVAIFIWLSCVWSSCSYVSQHVYLIAFYLLHYSCPFITWFTLRV